MNRKHHFGIPPRRWRRSRNPGNKISGRAFYLATTAQRYSFLVQTQTAQAVSGCRTQTVPPGVLVQPSIGTASMGETDQEEHEKRTPTQPAQQIETDACSCDNPEIENNELEARVHTFGRLISIPSERFLRNVFDDASPSLVSSRRLLRTMQRYDRLPALRHVRSFPKDHHCRSSSGWP